MTFGIDRQGRRQLAAGRVARFTALAAVLALAGCASPPPPPPPPKPTLLEAVVTAGAQVNPNSQQRPSPVMVRVFDLKSALAFEAADFVSLFNSERDALATDLVEREEFVLQPGESRRLQRPLKPEVKTLGIAVAFRDLERATWRVVVPVRPNATNKVTLTLDGIRVTATVAP
jgi:type VI secretion system protein VasD